MPGPVIRDYLLRDTVDYTAADVMALNPGAFPSADKVPPHLYLSLCTLWTGASGGANRIANYQRLLVANSGQGEQPAENSITISPMICESANAGGLEGELAQDDAIGAENAKISILFQTESAPAPNRQSATQNAELRVRLLLDNNLRHLSGKSGSIPIDNTHDLSVDDSYETFLLVWEGFGGDPSAQGLITIYNCTYVRCFAKTNIP